MVWRCTHGGVGRGRGLRVRWGAREGGGGGKKPGQVLEARSLRHAERTVLPAVAQRRKGGGRNGLEAAGEGGARRWWCRRVWGVGLVAKGWSEGRGTSGVTRGGGCRFGPRRVGCAWCGALRGGGTSIDNGPELGPERVVGGGGGREECGGCAG